MTFHVVIAIKLFLTEMRAEVDSVCVGRWNNGPPIINGWSDGCLAWRRRERTQHFKSSYRSLCQSGDPPFQEGQNSPLLYKGAAKIYNEYWIHKLQKKNALGPAPYPHVTVNIDNPQGRIQDLMLGGGTKFGKGSGDRLRSLAGPPRSSWVLSI